MFRKQIKKIKTGLSCTYKFFGSTKWPQMLKMLKNSLKKWPVWTNVFRIPDYNRYNNILKLQIT